MVVTELELELELEWENRYVFKVNNTIHLMSLIKLLTHLSKQADMNSSPAMLSFLASHISSHFTASLRLSPPFFADFPFNEHNKCRVFIDVFHHIMCTMLWSTFFSMTLHFIAPNGDFIYPGSLLVFQTSSTDQETAESKTSGLISLPSQGLNVGEIDFRCFFAIDMFHFKYIVMELHDYLDTIIVTMTDSQVKFSAGDIEIVLNKEENQCIIGRMGVEPEAEIQFLIVVHPKTFFFNLVFEPDPKMIWFFKSTNINPGSIIAIPFGLYAQIWLYFPHKA